ncbi:MAG: glycosyltransferase family 39 protein [Anaerolineae bacterium]|nr:glycosyltransferase family 39 protein [Anaerolineae bacterium]
MKRAHLVDSPILIALFILGSAILGGSSLNEHGFWYDETVSIGFITDSAHWYSISPEQMPLYYLALRGWTGVVGSSEVAGRWLSLLFGLMTLAVTYRIGKRHWSRPVATLAVLTLGSSAFFVRFYREMRPYTLLALLCTLSVWFFLEWIRERRRRDGFLWVLCAVLAIYTHYFAGLLVAVQGLYFLATWRRSAHRCGQRTTPTLAGFGVIALSVVPYLGAYFTGLEFVTSGRFSVFALTPGEAFDSLIRTLTNDSPAFFGLLVLLAISSVLRRRLLVLLWAFLPPAVVLLVHALFYRMFAGPRYLIFIWPAFAIVSALGILALSKSGGRLGVMCTTAVLLMTGVVGELSGLTERLPGVLNNPPWREMFAIAGERARPDALTIVNMVDLVGLTGYRQPMLYYVGKFMPAGASPPIELDFPPHPSPRDIQNRAMQVSEVWQIVTDGESNERGLAAQAALREAGYVSCRRWDFPAQRTHLTFWGRLTDNNLPYVFENGLHIYRTPLNYVKAAVAPGATLEIALGMAPTKPLLIDYSLGLYLLDDEGQVAAQSDGPPAGMRTSAVVVGERLCDYRMLHIPDAAGRYTLALALYDSATGARVPVDDGGDLVTLATLEVR